MVETNFTSYISKLKNKHNQQDRDNFEAMWDSQGGIWDKLDFLHRDYFIHKASLPKSLLNPPNQTISW